METIEYRPIKGLPKKYTTEYTISSLGDIFSRKNGDTLTRRVCSIIHGYKYVSFYKERKNGSSQNYTYLVHRLVAATFLGKCPKGCEVHHIDSNKLNNDVSNLKYVSRASNMIRGWCEGKFDKVSAAIKNKRKQLDGQATSLTPDDVRQIRRLREFLTNQQVGFIFDLHPMQISRIYNRRSFASIE